MQNSNIHLSEDTTIGATESLLRDFSPWSYMKLFIMVCLVDLHRFLTKIIFFNQKFNSIEFHRFWKILISPTVTIKEYEGKQVERSIIPH